MAFKFIQFNIQHGHYLDQLIRFLDQQQADILNLQEVTTKNLNWFKDKSISLFDYLKQKLSYPHGTFSPIFKVQNQPQSQLGNATLSRFPLSETHTYFYHKRYQAIDPTNHNYEEYPRAVLKAQLKIGQKRLTIFNTHFVWTPQGQVTPTQLKAAKKLKQYLNRSDHFILSGDFNTYPQSQVYQLIQKNLVDDSPSNLDYTIHPQLHEVGYKRLYVDYLFHCGKNIRLQSSKIFAVPASDHLPLVAQYQLN